jgi:protein-S-isoprenylcysteine O-methyltransferase
LIIFQPRPLLVLYLALLVIFVIGEALPLNRRAREYRIAEDRGFRLTVLVVFIASNWVAVFCLKLFPSLAFATYATSCVGIAAMLFGLLLRWWAVLHLGRYFTVDLAVAPDQPVIESGPYKLIRHPSYTGALLVVIGVALCFGNFASMGAILLPFTVLLMKRIRLEESALASGLGEPYLDYMKRTNRLFPGLY